jgi:hypothetical protein
VEQIIARNAADHDEQIGQVKISIEPEGHKDEKNPGRPFPVQIQQAIISEQANRKKQKYKNIGIK